MSGYLYMSPPDVGEVEEEYVLRALRSGWVAPTGPEVTAFEQEMAARVGTDHAVAMTSGTAALHLAMLGLGVQPGDIVIVATLTFVASANAVMYTGAEPYFVDVLEEDGNLDPDLLRDAILDLRRQGRRIGAVMPVDLLGKAADYTSIAKVCDEFEVPMLEDAAEALGATHRGAPAGSFGRAAALSFNGNKIMTTSGGGMLVTNEESLAERARFLSTQAREPVPYYEHKVVGYNYRLSNILAALGRAQLSRLDEMIARRRAIKQQYQQLVGTFEGVRIFAAEGADEANCWLSAIILEPGTSRATQEEVLAALTAADIEGRSLWNPMHRQPLFAKVGVLDAGVAERLFRTGITLPSGSRHGHEAIQRVCEVLQSVLGAR